MTMLYDPNAGLGDNPEQINQLPPDDTSPAPGTYTPPAVVGEILVTADWQSAGCAPSLRSWALPAIIRLRVGAETDAGGPLDPAGVPLQFALSGSASPAGADLEWIDATYDGATRLAEIAIPAGTVAGNYFGIWRVALTENTPNLQADVLSGILRIV